MKTQTGLRKKQATKNIFSATTRYFISICFVASCLQSTVFADEIKPPFGIRHYDIGSAENFSLQDIDGETFEFNNTKGHWVFLHFWASWCGPCQEEMPAVQRLADIMQDRLNIVMINTAEDEDTIFTFLGTLNVELNSLIDKDGLVTEVWKPRGLPTTFLINPQGEIKYQAIGGREWDKPQYINFIRQLVKVAE